MNMHTKGFRIILIIVFLMAAPLAAGADTAYLGAGIGQSGAKISKADFAENDFGFKVYGGYWFSKFAAVELGYLDYTKIGSAEKPGWTSVEAAGFDAAVLGRLPLMERLDLFGKAGVLFWSTDLHVNVGGTIMTVSDDGTSPGFGFGLLSRLNDRVSLRFEFDWYEAEFGGLDGKLRLLTLGAMYAF